MLQDLEIVEATKGSGVMIKSYEKAAQFVQQFLEVQSIQQIHIEMLESMKRQKEELNFLQEITERLVGRTERFRSINPFVPFQIEVLEHSPYISHSIGEINFWQNTSATIVGIKRGQELFISPGPYITIEPNDIIYFIGNDECLERVEKFLYSKLKGLRILKSKYPWAFLYGFVRIDYKIGSLTQVTTLCYH